MKKCRGITLIALVITIIVLLILAGVSLNLIAGEEGILKRATSAVDKNKVETVKEDVELVVADLGTGYYEEKYDKGSQNFGDVDDYIESQFGLNREMFDGSQAKIKKKKVEVSQDGKLIATGALENGKIIWDANPKEKEKPLPMEPTAVFAKLYEDHTLILSSTDYTDPDREVSSDYGDISNSEETPGWISIDDYLGPSSSARSIIIHDKIAPTSTKEWFMDLQEEIINFENLNTSNVTNMAYMFAACELRSLDLSTFDTSKVTDMNSMFFWKNALRSIDLSSFDTSNVTNMSRMFDDCSSLTSLDLSSFDTSKVTDMNSMFFWNRDLTSLDLSSFDISNVTNMNSMFTKCDNLEVIWVRNQAMKEKFESNSNLKFEIKPTR